MEIANKFPSHFNKSHQYEKIKNLNEFGHHLNNNKSGFLTVHRPTAFLNSSLFLQ